MYPFWGGDNKDPKGYPGWLEYICHREFSFISPNVGLKWGNNSACYPCRVGGIHSDCKNAWPGFYWEAAPINEKSSGVGESGK